MESLRSSETDQYVHFHFGWDEFERFLELRGDQAGARLTYLDGVMEIMSPSSSHEADKCRLRRLLEMWALHEDLDLASFGSATFKNRSQCVGLEAAESYAIGRIDVDAPDLALELGSGIDKLDAYHRLGVPEVWFWEANKLLIYQHRTTGYVKRAKSAVLPSLDVKFFSTFIAEPDQLRAVRNFRDALRQN
ncbi:MAG: Uma2 family endonuclease [Archangium sp.]